jgi:hypothetical protein
MFVMLQIIVPICIINFLFLYCIFIVNVMKSDVVVCLLCVESFIIALSELSKNILKEKDM